MCSPHDNWAERRMIRIFNLSYDISKELAEKTHVKEDDLLSRETFMKVLIDEKVIDPDYLFRVGSFEHPSSYHKVLNPVKTTIVFKSDKKRDKIVEVLARYSNQLHYVITEVKEDEELYLGSLHENQEEQASCDEIIQKILDNQ